MTMKLKYKLLQPYPEYFTVKPQGDAAIDLRVLGITECRVPKAGRFEITNTTATPLETRDVSLVDNKYQIYSGRVYLVKTGISVEIPENHMGRISMRSSTGLRGFFIPNAPGTIDSGYRGEVMVEMISLYHATLERGVRMFQMAILPKQDIQPILVNELSETERGAGGFGSTGR